jgi:hypothetical protein
MYWREQSITRVFALLTGLAVAIDGILTLDSSTVDWPPVLPCAVFTLCHARSPPCRSGLRGNR